MPQRTHPVPVAIAARGAAPDSPGADSSQAQYFRHILDSERAKLDEKIVKDLRKLAALGTAEGPFGAKALRRRIRTLQRQRQELNRLIRALDSRFYKHQPALDLARGTGGQSLRCARGYHADVVP